MGPPHFRCTPLIFSCEILHPFTDGNEAFITRVDGFFLFSNFDKKNNFKLKKQVIKILLKYRIKIKLILKYMD